MKKIMVMLVLLVSLFGVSIVAGARDVPIFECRASSAYAVGWGQATNAYDARAIALNECAVRTPYGYNCYVNWCRQVR